MADREAERVSKTPERKAERVSKTAERKAVGIILDPNCCNECEERVEQLNLLHTCPVCKQSIHDCKSNGCLERLSRTKMFLGALATLFTGAAALGGFLSGWFLK